MQQREVIGRNIADQCQCDDLARIFGGQQFGTGGFRCATQLSEKIELESSVSSERQKVILGLLEILLATVKGGVAGNLRKQTGTRNRKLSAGGTDAFGCKLEIVVLFERRANEFLQLRILKHLPPWEIGI